MTRLIYLTGLAAFIAAGLYISWSADGWQRIVDTASMMTARIAS